VPAEVAAQVLQEPRTVGVVAEDMALAQGEGIHGPRSTRTWRQFLCESEGILLERQGHVHAASALREKQAGVFRKLAQRDQQPSVFQVLSGLRREARVDKR
jgi:hypothetical protein